MEPESAATSIVQSSLFLGGFLVVLGMLISFPVGIVLIFLKTHKKLGIFLVMGPIILVAAILTLFAIANLLV